MLLTCYHINKDFINTTGNSTLFLSSDKFTPMHLSVGKSCESFIALIRLPHQKYNVALFTA